MVAPPKERWFDPPPAAAGEPAGRSSPAPAVREIRLRMATITALAAVAGGYLAWTRVGSRLPLFLGLAAGFAVALDLAVALVTTRRTAVRVTAAPTEAVVGDPLAFGLEVRGPRLTAAVRVSFVTPAAIVVEPPSSGTVDVVADRRCVVTEVEEEVVGNGLCGLVTVRRRRVVPLPAPLAVGPRPLQPPVPLPEPPPGWGDGSVRPSAVGDVVRGVRDYVPGDPARHIHWRASARRGDLVVKEVEEPVATDLHLALELAGGGSTGEEAARRAAWYGREALARGYHLVLSTVARGGPVMGVVDGTATLNRRLAEAIPGPLTVPPGSGGPGRVFVVSPRGDRWR